MMDNQTDGSSWDDNSRRDLFITVNSRRDLFSTFFLIYTCEFIMLSYHFRLLLERHGSQSYSYKRVEDQKMGSYGHRVHTDTEDTSVYT